MQLETYELETLLRNAFDQGYNAGKTSAEVLGGTAVVNKKTVDALVYAVWHNEKIPAIKAYRELLNVGLKDAKDAIEENTKGNNQLW